MAYVNLPGTYPTLLDGNLRQFIPNADPITLVIGTAPSGFTGELYAVDNVNTALVEFGRTSEVGRGIVEARDGGASNIVAMRLSGLAPVLERVGAEHSGTATNDTGFTVTPTLASSEAADRYGIAYKHARNYAASGSGVADTHEVVGELVIVDLLTEQLVWYGDLTGRTFEDLGLMDIVVDDFYDGSTTTDDESFTIYVANQAIAGGDAVFTIGGKAVSVTFIGGESPSAAATLIANALTADADLACFSFTDSAAGVLVEANGTTNADGELVYPSTHPTRAGLLARPALESFNDGSTGLEYTVSVGAGFTGSYDIGVFPSNGLFPFSVTGGGEFVALDDVVAALTAITTAMGSNTTPTADTVANITLALPGTAGDTYVLTDAGTITGTPVVIGSVVVFDGAGGVDLVAPSSTGSQAAFTAGDTGEAISLMERYQKYHEAFTLLDFRDFDIVLPQGVTLDADNIADGATSPTLAYDLQGEDGEAAIVTTGGGYGLVDAGKAWRVTAPLTGTLPGTAAVGDIYAWDGAAFALVPTGTDIFPIPGSTNDVLGKIAVIENADYTFTYYWDTDGDGVANISSDGTFSSSAATAAGLTYYEANFAHQLAIFCYQASEDFQFCHGVIGTSTPSSLSPRGIRNFFGRLPTYTYDPGLETDVVKSSGDDGTGLLGHKLVGGKFGFNSNIKNGGIMLTDGGYFNSGSIVEDANGVDVDLGKYISVVAAFGHLRNEFNDRTGGYLTNLANVYGGLITDTPENESTTAQRMPAVQMRYYMPGAIADAAAGSRLITLINDEGTPTIADGPTFALLTSDYTRLTTMRIVAKVVEEVRLASRPFLGKGMSTGRRLAHETSLQSIIQKNVAEDETITAGNFTISQTRAQRVEGKMDLELVLTPVFELRQILLSVALSA